MKEIFLFSILFKGEAKLRLSGLSTVKSEFFQPTIFRKKSLQNTKKKQFTMKTEISGKNGKIWKIS